MSVVAELATKITFQGNLAPLTKLNHGLTSGITNIAKVAGAFTTAGIALGGFLAYALSGADAQIQLARETNVSVEKLQEWGYIASVNGSSANALENSIRNLSKRIGEASIQGNSDFSRLGISVRDSMNNVKSADTIIKELSLRFKQLGLSIQEQKAYLDKFGIDESLLQTMRLSSDEFDKLTQRAKALGTVTTEEANQIAEFNDSLTTLKYGLSNVAKHLSIAFAPQLKDLANDFVDLLIANNKLIHTGLTNFFAVTNGGIGAITKFGGALYDLIDNTIGVKNALILAGGAMLYLNRAMYLNPMFKIMAKISALILAYDELDVALRGGKSVIADWFSSFLGVDIVSVIKSWGFELDEFIFKIKNMWPHLTNNFSLTDFFSDNFDFDKKIGITNSVLNKETALEESRLDARRAIGSATPADLASLMSMRNEEIATSNITNNDISKIATSNITNKHQSSNSNINNINIEVKADNPRLAGENVKMAIENMLNISNAQFGTGGM